ncbi:MAG: hypothetical protein HY901_36315 [Deltaproteobacteria bacterium]|nr:hypothetical protein [Deltaproteobacteria bacterium]
MAETSPVPDLAKPVPQPDPQLVAARPVPIRTLFVNFLFATFAAVVVFTIASFFFLLPRIALQSRQLAELQHQVRSLNAFAASHQASDDARPVPAIAPANTGSPAPTEPSPAPVSAK